MSITEINAIDENYPVAGVDQGSQTFRDNFTNIKTALTDLDLVVITVIDDLSDVDTTSVAPVTDDVLVFNGVNWVPGNADVVNDTTPQLGGNLDVNGFHLGDGTTPIVDLVKSTTPANWLIASNADTGANPSLVASGADANIDLVLGATGNGSVIIDSDTSTSRISASVDSSLEISSSDNASGNGHNLTLAAGSSTGVSGNDGGSITLRPGAEDTTGSAGSVYLRDSLNNTVVKFRGTTLGIGVNNIYIRNAPTGDSPAFTAIGSDANVGIYLLPKGTGRIKLSGLGYPTADGSAGQVMKTSGTGFLGFTFLSDLGEYTVAGLPDPTARGDSYALATDASGGRTVVRSDGTNWKVIAVEGATVTV